MAKTSYNILLQKHLKKSTMLKIPKTYFSSQQHQDHETTLDAITRPLILL